jgi:cytochrome c oxidase assembly factor CtaG
MNAKTPLLASQRVVQICLFLVTAIALFNGALQMYLGEPETAPRLDNVHRFMAGVYFGSGFIGLWAALTIRQQRTLVFLIALSVFLAGTGRLVSISQVGLPQPNAVWIGYLLPELLLPWIMVVAQIVTNKSSAASRK